MKVLYLFTSSFPFGKGENFLETEIVYLSKTFREITIVPYQYGGVEKARLLPSNVKILQPLRSDKAKFIIILLKGIFNLKPFKIFALDLLKLNVRSISHFRRWIRETIITRWLLGTKAIETIIQQKDQSILYFYWSSGPTSSNLSLVLGKKIKTAVRFHGSDLYLETDNNKGYIPFREQQLNNINIAITISELGKNYLNNNYPKIKFETKTFPLGSESFGLSNMSDDGTLRIVSCSSISQIKRVHIIANAIKELDIPIVWIHFGDGPLRSSIEQIMVEKNSNIKFELRGQVEHKEILSFYHNSNVDVFINVSSSEGIPVSIMEALSFGISIIATDVGGTSEIVDENIGFLLPSTIEFTDLRRAIVKFHNLSSAEKLLLRANARKTWEQKADASKNYTEFALFLAKLANE